MSAAPALALQAEWLETDGGGGFSSGTVAGYRTRRYHALLLTAMAPPCGRVVLVNGVEATLELASGAMPVSTQRYAPDVVYPRGLDHLVAFTTEPWPQWTFRFADGTTLVHEIFLANDEATVVLTWKRIAGTGPATLRARPLISGRDYHSLMRENGAFDFTAKTHGGNVSWHPYAPLPVIAALSSGSYRHEPDWYRNFLYAEEQARGLDCIEDLASPGTFSFDLAAGEATLVFRTGEDIDADAVALATRLRNAETQRRGTLVAVDRAADAFIVRRGTGRSIIAGYPWFTDWGRDTFIAMRGLVLSRGRMDLAASILGDWSDAVSEGMLPNRFPDQGETAQYNAVDASLWFVIVAYEYLASGHATTELRAKLASACEAILDGYTRGTRFRIAMDHDGLLACGEPGVQLTWMDAKVGDHVITPRIGKPVEVQALWINALRAAGGRFLATAERAQASFAARFWNEQAGCLYDVVDADHVAGRNDASIRPNQIFAVGGLPFGHLPGDRARAVVAVVENTLVTPAGLRSLAPSDPAYKPYYQGGPEQRDGAYHQGTVWPWLMGAFVDAWLRVNGDDPLHRAQARARFVAPLASYVGVAGIGHLCEIADGDAPHTPRGCPFQAWSLGELFRARRATQT